VELPDVLVWDSGVLWKVFWAIAILVPRFPRLKEWADAGIFFHLTGAAASFLAVGVPGAYGLHLLALLALTVLTMVSRALRPEGRSIGAILAGKSIGRGEGQHAQLRPRPAAAGLGIRG